ncbi:hypothetical protein BE04_28370 [Sorangium cellulosum]|uniref:Uncharacterized protein n=1 Tax=Sorangium cellulosum TaxID=56 RepID=A0A150PWZ0_SORCE|nr:hypothetical protein BE04_28370 [Sorangium cellulosum]
MTERKRHKKRMRARAQRMGNAKYTEALRALAASVIGEAKLPGVADAAPESVLGLDDFIERQGAQGADGAFEGVRRGEGEDDFGNEDCATEAEAKSEALRFAQAHQRRGYEVNILDEPGLVSVWVKRPIPGPEEFDEVDKRFTFPKDDQDSPDDIANVSPYFDPEDEEEARREKQFDADVAAALREQRVAILAAQRHPGDERAFVLLDLNVAPTTVSAASIGDLKDRFPMDADWFDNLVDMPGFPFAARIVIVKGEKIRLMPFRDVDALERAAQVDIEPDPCAEA